MEERESVRPLAVRENAHVCVNLVLPLTCTFLYNSHFNVRGFKEREPVHPSTHKQLVKIIITFENSGIF